MPSNTKPSSRRFISFERVRPKSRVAVVPRTAGRATGPPIIPSTTRRSRKASLGQRRSSDNDSNSSQPSFKQQEISCDNDVGVSTHSIKYKTDRRDKVNHSSLSGTQPQVSSEPLKRKVSAPEVPGSAIEQGGPPISAEVPVTPSEGSFVARARASIAAAAAASVAARAGVIPTDTRNVDLDGTMDQSLRREPPLNPNVLAAISKAVEREFRRLPVATLRKRPSRQADYSQTFSADTHGPVSRTRSEQRTFRRFTRDLERYARNTNAYGRYHSFTPTSRSDPTLRTVSALLPYREELRVAGLAVSSHDQARYGPSAAFHRPNSHSGCSAADKATQPRLSQVDGQHDNTPANNPDTIIPFPPRQEMDEWRYALVNEVPIEKPKRRSTVSHGKSRWLPCLKGSAQSSDAGIPFVPHAVPAVRSPTFADPHWKPNRPLNQFKSSSPPMVQAPQDAVEIATPDAPSGAQHTRHVPRDRRITGRRRPSMVLRSNVTPEIRPNLKTQLDPSTRYSKLYRHMSAAKGKKKEDDKEVKARLSIYRPVTQQAVSVPHSQDSMQDIPQPLIGAENKTRPQDPAVISTSQGWPFAQDTIPSPGPVTQYISKARVCGSRSVPDLRQAFQDDDLLGAGKNRAGYSVGPAEPITKAGKKPRTNTFATGTRDSLPRNAPRKRDSAASRRHCRADSAEAKHRPHIPKRTSSVRGSPRLLSLRYERDKPIDDRTILRRVGVAISAVCDTKMDLSIRESLGIDVRQVFAALAGAQSDSGVGVTGNVEEWVRQRRRDMKRLKKDVRTSREMEKATRGEGKSSEL